MTFIAEPSSDPLLCMPVKRPQPGVGRMIGRKWILTLLRKVCSSARVPFCKEACSLGTLSFLTKKFHTHSRLYIPPQSSFIRLTPTSTQINKAKYELSDSLFCSLNYDSHPNSGIPYIPVQSERSLVAIYQADFQSRDPRSRSSYHSRRKITVLGRDSQHTYSQSWLLIRASRRFPRVRVFSLAVARPLHSDVVANHSEAAY